LDVKSTPQNGNFSRHVAEIQRRYDAALEVSGCNVAVVGAGVPEYRFLDDQPHPFVGNPDFLQWVPLTEHPGSCLVHRPGSRPLLVVLQPNDYWHEPPTMPDEIITREFDVRVVGTPAEVLAALPAPNPRMAYIGPGTQWNAVPAPAQLNPEKLLSYLHYQRANKTAWEVDCIRTANELAAAGHRAAERGFRDGGNEFEILNMFLGGCRQLEPELPYPAIVALNGHAATLHYQRRARTPIASGDRHSLLIDAGCSSRGYASDITRTYSYSSTEFAGMVQDMDRLQQKLCAEVRPGVAFPDLHRLAHHEIAGLLRGWGLVRATPEAICANGTSFAFFPHGLGHYLGLQVHDLGGQLADAKGGRLPQPDDYPRLRLLRTLEAGQVVTIEPGLYFIGSLLDGLRASPAGRDVDWRKIDGLRVFGGIRIEDDVLVTAGGFENLTRPGFEAA
jgi:Xaa-Pro dipeptidase